MSFKEFIHDALTYRIVRTGGGAPYIYQLYFQQADIFGTVFYTVATIPGVGADNLHTLLEAYYDALP